MEKVKEILKDQTFFFHFQVTFFILLRLGIFMATLWPVNTCYAIFTLPKDLMLSVFPILLLRRNAFKNLLLGPADPSIYEIQREIQIENNIKLRKQYSNSIN